MPQADHQYDDLAKARTLLATRRFIKLDEWLMLQMRGWQYQTDANSQYGYVMNVSSLFGGVELSQIKRLEILNDWAQQCPESYHAQVLLGMFWHEQAWYIRSAPAGQEVEDHQWLGAQLCCDYAVLAFLQAIALHPRPTHAYRHMMNLSGGFGEPYWLRALFAGEIPKPLSEQFDIQNSEVWHQGVAHLQALGAEAALYWPQQLPKVLINSRRDGEEALDYWLRMAMSVRHSDVGTLESYLVFHSPQWGGSHEQVEQIIESALCSEFDERDRNQFRANALLDALAGDVAERDTPRATALQQRLAALLSQPLPWETRIALLDAAGTCVAYWHDDDDAGLAVYDDLLNVSPQALPGRYATLFISRVILANGHDDQRNVLGRMLARAAPATQSALQTALAACACQFGLYGLPQNEELAHTLMDHAWALTINGADPSETEKDLVTIAHDMAIHEDIEAAHFMLLQMAHRGSAWHSYELFFFHRDAWHEDVPQALQDPQAALQWVGHAANSGHVPAMFAYANALREGVSAPADYPLAMEWYRRAIDNGYLTARYWRATCALEEGPEEEKRLAVAEWLPEILQDSASDTRAEAAYSLGMAWLMGLGTEKNRYHAHQLFSFALEMNPQFDAAQRAVSELTGSLRSRMALWQDKRKVNSEDLLAAYRV